MQFSKWEFVLRFVLAITAEYAFTEPYGWIDSSSVPDLQRLQNIPRTAWFAYCGSVLYICTTNIALQWILMAPPYIMFT